MLRQVIVICGLLATVLGNPGGRIVNGTDAKEGEFPSIISIQYKRNHICGGTILDETHILTAGHCAYGIDFTLLTVQYGVVNVVNSDANIVPVIDAVTHEDYVAASPYFNDVAILTVGSPITYSDNVQPTILPLKNSAVPAGSVATVAGWGYEKNEGTKQAHLQKADLMVFSDDECEKAYDNVTDRDYHLCSGVPGGGKGQCTNDSGGPLYQDGVQIGVVSWSKKPCTSPGYPGVMVKLSKYVDWINEKLIAKNIIVIY